MGAEPMVDPEPKLEREVILVVDDDPGVLHVASKVLRRDGYRVLEATGGLEALKLVDEMDGQIDLLVTDVAMPGMGGREVSDAVMKRVPGVRVVFMSGYTEDQILLQGVRVGEVNFISKPFTVDDLRSRVRAILDQG